MDDLDSQDEMGTPAEEDSQGTEDSPETEETTVQLAHQELLVSTETLDKTWLDATE
jgi:hypothetical protein